ncbi:MAG: hypothetical protein A2086_04650, partial [Spirochaetes bacterium GWD1_27_9]
LILIDGIPMNSIQSGNFGLNLIDINSIEKIEVVFGGSDTKYNFSGAIGGLINIITKKKNKAGYKISGMVSNCFYYPDFYYIGNSEDKKFSYWYDFFDTQNINLNFGIGNQKVYWNINGTGNRAANHYIYKDDKDTKRRTTDNELWDGSCNSSLLINLPYYMKLILSGSFYYGNKNIPGPINNTNKGNQIDILSNGSISLDADYVGNENIDTELIVNYKFQNIDWKDSLSNDNHKLSTINFINRWGFWIKDWFTINLGGDFQYDYLDSSNIGIIPVFNGGGYVTLNFNIKNIAKIIPSVKLIYYKEYPIAIPKLGFIFNIGKYFVLKNNYFRVFKLPTINDLYWPKNSYAEGNPNLKFEDGVGGDIVLSFYKKKILSAESSFYVTYLADAIIWQPKPKGVYSPLNVGKAFYFGIDNKVESDFSQYVKLSVSYSLLLTYCLNGDLTFESDKRMPYVPLHSLSFGVEFNWKTGNLNFAGHFESERYATISNVTELKPFFTMDVNFSQNIKMVTIFASIKNAFNYLYFLIDGYAVPGGSVILGVKVNYEGSFKKN